jgi:hypothetical protein
MNINKHISTFMVKAKTEFETSIGAVSRGIGIMILYSVIILSLLMVIIVNVGEGNALAAEHQITIINNCSGKNIPMDKIYVGINPKPTSVKISGITITTLGGWEMDKGQEADVIVPAGWTSGRIWARTGCNFNNNGLCPSPTSTIAANCCDTGGCTNSDGKFGVDCTNTGVPPATLAEFTMDGAGGKDFYDVSMVDGGNIPILIEPDLGTYDIEPGIDPNRDSCNSDSDCDQTSAFSKCSSVQGETNKKCVDPYYCSSPGCRSSAGCANPAFEDVRDSVAWSQWGAIYCHNNSECGPNGMCISGYCDSMFAIKEDDCPEKSRFYSNLNVGNKYVGCIAPQKFCRKVCFNDSGCDVPQTCIKNNPQDSSGFCGLNNKVLGWDCESKSIGCVTGADCISPSTCVNHVCTPGTGTTKEDLWGCSGKNGKSCFQANADSECCGCPSWVLDVNPSFCIMDNPEWHTVAEPVWGSFHNAAPPVYSYPYDDKIATYTCKGLSSSAYTVTLCPQGEVFGIGGSGGNATGGGCSIASAGATPSIPLYLIIPSLILIARLWRRRTNKKHC